MKKIWILAVIVGALYGGASVLAMGSDSPSGWAAEPVRQALELGIVPERLQSDYQSPITREEFAELLVRTVFAWEKQRAEMEQDSVYWTPEQLLRQAHLDVQFEDAGQDHVKLAYILGSVNGVSDTRFAPDQYITRQEAATMLVNTSHIANGIRYWSKDELGYADYDEIAEWAKPAVQAAASVGYMQGVGGKFDYDGKFTREQSIATMIRLFHSGYLFALRGHIAVSADFAELQYHIGKDYVKVFYRDDGEYTELDKFAHERWNSFPVTSENKDSFSMEKAIAIFAFAREIRPADFTGIVTPTMEGRTTKWDYGYMNVSVFNPDSTISFSFKPDKGYMSETQGYKYSYPFKEVTVMEIPNQ